MLEVRILPHPQMNKEEMSVKRKAEKQAAEQFPHETYQGEEGDSMRWAYILGYLQGHSDNALIVEDVSVIFYLVKKLQYKYNDVSGCFAEALRLFNEAKEDADKR